jgi:hypothetical protein
MIIEFIPFRLIALVLSGLAAFMAGSACYAQGCTDRSKVLPLITPPNFLVAPVGAAGPASPTIRSTLGIDLRMPLLTENKSRGFGNSEWSSPGALSSVSLGGVGIRFEVNEPLRVVGGLDIGRIGEGPQRTLPDNARATPTPPASGYDPKRQEEIANAMVLVHALSSGDHEIIVRVCNGVYLGSRRVLTSGHCADASNSLFVIQFGELDAPTGQFPTQFNLQGEQKCSARVAFMPNDAAPQKALDYAVLALDAAPASKFQAGLKLDRGLDWNASETGKPHQYVIAPTDTSALTPPPPNSHLLALAQIWLPKVQDGGSFGAKTIEPSSPDKPSQCFAASRVGSQNDACVPRDILRFSVIGDPNGCDSVEGSSGAPLLSRSTVSGAGSLRIAGIVKSGNNGTAAWNCAVSSRLICADLERYAANAALRAETSAIARSLLEDHCETSQ